jgi:demethylmenaquinone methyltransferase / 2-methoxy-6-polyprenyl-1,4-benzoquinol methylase
MLCREGTMSDVEWSDQTSRDYTRYMETVVRRDHRPCAQRILADFSGCPRGATVVDVAGGPAFMLLEVGPHIPQSRMILLDASPTMIELGRERAAARGLKIEGRVCPAERLDLPDAVADLVLCSHFLRLARDLDATLREVARVLRPGGRAYLSDFDREGPWLLQRLLLLYIRLTAPSFLSRNFGETLRIALPASTLPGRLRAAGFSDARILHRSVSYLIRADR